MRSAAGTTASSSYHRGGSARNVSADVGDVGCSSRQPLIAASHAPARGVLASRCRARSACGVSPTRARPSGPLLPRPKARAGAPRPIHERSATPPASRPPVAARPPRGAPRPWCHAATAPLLHGLKEQPCCLTPLSSVLVNRKYDQHRTQQPHQRITLIHRSYLLAAKLRRHLNGERNGGNRFGVRPRARASNPTARVKAWPLSRSSCKIYSGEKSRHAKVCLA